MEEKILDMSKTVYELCTADPEILPILAELGFTDITKPGMLVTAGRFMGGGATTALDARSATKKAQLPSSMLIISPRALARLI